MKKLLTILALGCGVTSVFAQDLTSKKGEQILPEAGDWSIGVDATPFLEYMGNFFGKSSTNAAPTFTWLNTNQTITGKYFVEAQKAYRASLRLGFGSQSQKSQVADRSYIPSTTGNTYPNTSPMKENDWKHSSTNIGLSVGMEIRKGKTRLQGYYGAEAGINFSSSKDKFTYGNALNPTGTSSVVVDNADNFSSASNVVDLSGVVPGIQGAGLGRITERKNGATFSFGARAFIGVEYFILPKISLGGEFGWGLGLSTTGKTSTTYESTGNTGSGSDQTGSTTIAKPNGGLFKLDTDNTNSIFGASAAIRLNFHF
jgi:hypothetical protein